MGGFGVNLAGLFDRKHKAGLKRQKIVEFYHVCARGLKAAQAITTFQRVGFLDLANMFG